VKLSLAGRETQGQAVINRPTRLDVYAGSQTLADTEPQTQVAMRRPSGVEVAQETEAVKLALKCREPHAQAVMSRPSGADVAQVVRRSEVGSGNQVTAGLGIHEQSGRGRRWAGRQSQ
jgi:hypothetical protein